MNMDYRKDMLSTVKHTRNEDEMGKITLRILCLFACFIAVPGIGSWAQQGHRQWGQNKPEGPEGPGGPGGVNGPGGAGNLHTPRRADRQTRNAASGPQHNALQFGPVGRWWDDHSVMQQIGLSRDQQRKMDSIFDANKPAILASYKTFLKAQSNLNAVNKDTNADKATVFSAIDAVNNARSDLQKATSAMLMLIRGEMNPDQIAKLEKVQ
jgi:Spy/CpxP family protein refolding chaperone